MGYGAASPVNGGGGSGQVDWLNFLSTIFAFFSLLVAAWALKKAYDTLVLAKEANTIARAAVREERAARDLATYERVNAALTQLAEAGPMSTAPAGQPAFVQAKKQLEASLTTLGTGGLKLCRRLSTPNATGAEVAASLDEAKNEIAAAVQKAREDLA
jgi:hypothetical protein